MPSRLKIASAAVAATVAVVAGVAVTVGLAGEDTPPVAGPAPVASSAAPTAKPVLPAAAAPKGLTEIDYWQAPDDFPADPAPLSTAAVTEGLRVTTDRVVYDAPGGKPRAKLPASISGLPVTVPIVERQAGWVAVLLPSINRKVGWLPDGDSAISPLPDQLILRRRTHELTWLRDGARHLSWTVTTGAKATATPLGRTFVLGRVKTSGRVYAGLDALALGSVPDNRESLPASLRAGHTAFHSWHHTGTFGRSVSNGCIRVPKSGQRALLKGIPVGTVVTVID